jgi:GNAT superfamily N-acetyltransferase
MRGAPTAQPVIRAASPADRTGISDFFAGLSLESRARRFFAAIMPSRAMLDRLSGVAGGPDAARPRPAATAGSSGGEVIVAMADGVIVGHGMAADRTADRGERMTDIGVVVADAWQGQGIGAALVRALLAGARARGATWLTMDVLPGNQPVLAMIASHWASAGTERSADCLTFRVRLTHRERDRILPGQGRRATTAAIMDSWSVAGPAGRPGSHVAQSTMPGGTRSSPAKNAVICSHEWA